MKSQDCSICMPRNENGVDDINDGRVRIYIDNAHGMGKSMLSKFLTVYGKVIQVEKTGHSLHCYADFEKPESAHKLLTQKECLFSTSHLKRVLIPSLTSDCPCKYCKQLKGNSERYYDEYPDEYEEPEIIDLESTVEAISKYRKKSIPIEELKKYCACPDCSNWGTLSSTTDQKCRTCGQSNCSNKVYWKCSKHENIGP